MTSGSNKDKAHARLKRAAKSMELVQRLHPTFVDRHAIEQELKEAIAAVDEIEGRSCKAA